jgi:hypothetical protein
MEEIWKEIPKELNLSKYIISSHGNIKHIKKDKYLSVKIIKHTGYVRNTFVQDNNKPKSYSIHRLVAITFLENPNNYEIVDHINNIKHDNKLSNLRWVNSQQNAVNRIGKSTAWKKQIEQIENEIVIKSWNSIKEAVDTLKMPSISSYVDKNKIYNGFYWKSKNIEIDNEIWKEMNVNDKTISVSNMGRVKTINGSITIGTIRNGYLVITVCKKPYYVHRLVYSNFNNIPLDKIEVVDHIDNNRQNNKLENLNISTIKKNSQKALNKIVELYDDQNNYIKTYNSLTELCQDKEFKIPVICNAIKNNKSFKGFIFKYVI